MALTSRSGRPRLRSLTLALALAALFAVPALTPSVSAQPVETEEDGRHTAASAGYRPQFYLHTSDIVQENFNPGNRRLEGDPLFGVQPSR